MSKLQDEKIERGEIKGTTERRAEEFLAQSSKLSNARAVGNAVNFAQTGLEKLDQMLAKFDERGYSYAESPTFKQEFDRDLADLRNELAQRIGMKPEQLELRLVRDPSYTGLKGQNKYLLAGTANIGDRSHGFILTWQGDLLIANDQEAFAKFLASDDRLEAKANLERAIRFPVKEIGPQHVPVEMAKSSLEQAAAITQQAKSPVIQTRTGEFLAVEKSEREKMLAYLNKGTEKDKPGKLFVAIKNSKGEIELVKADEFGFRETGKQREFFARVGDTEFVLDSLDLSRTGIGRTNEGTKAIYKEFLESLREGFGEGLFEHTRGGNKGL